VYYCIIYETVSNVTILATPGLVLLSNSTFAAVPTAPSCDRECLRGTVTQVLYALVEHDMSKLRGYRQDIIVAVVEFAAGARRIDATGLRERQV
jgi:hypothetical protein